jgi:hypothetical protein
MVQDQTLDGSASSHEPGELGLDAQLNNF